MPTARPTIGLLQSVTGHRYGVDVRTIRPDQVRAMLADAAGRFGLDLDRFQNLGRSGELVEPELRDLWLIWGPVVEDTRGRPATHA